CLRPRDVEVALDIQYVERSVVGGYLRVDECPRDDNRLELVIVDVDLLADEIRRVQPEVARRPVAGDRYAFIDGVCSDADLSIVDVDVRRPPRDHPVLGGPEKDGWAR